VLRHGGVAALVADRDLSGDGIEVTMFGHRTTLPAGPATLAVRTGRPLLVGRVLRVGPDRFTGDAWPVKVPLSGDRRRDVVALTEGIAAGFERAIAEAPEQWWAAFQPFWLDQRRAAERDA
jgi:KDO2-lipid IV(A) lauroyltransferase